MAGGWADAVRNTSSVSDIMSVVYNTLAPTVVVSASSAILAAGQTDTITFAFSGAVTGFDLADVSVTGGTLSSLQQVTGDPTHYTATFTPTAGVTGQTAQIQVLAGGWSDAVGNACTVCLHVALPIYTLAPTVVVSASSAILAAGQTDT